MVKKFILLMLTVVIGLHFKVSTYASEYPSPTLKTVTSAVVMDADSGTVLYSLNQDARVYPASTTKIMTILLALENKKLDDQITMSYEATHQIEFGSSHIALKENEVISVEDALYATSIASANDAANGLGEAIAGSQEEFANMMNERAKQLNANNTHFMNAHGLHDENHYTTAYDFALIMKEGIKHPEFLRILAKTYYEIQPTALTNEIRYLHGSNRTLLKETNQYVDGIQASKTGYTTNSGHTQVSYASRDGKNIIVTVFGGEDKLERFNDTKQLFEYAFENYNLLSTQNISISSLSLDLPKNYKFNSKEYYTLNLPAQILAYKDTDAFPITSYSSNIKVNENAQVGEVVGNIEFIQNSKIIATGEVILNAKIVKKSSLLHILIYILFALLLLLIILILILFTIRQYFKHKKQYKKRF